MVSEGNAVRVAVQTHRCMAVWKNYAALQIKALGIIEQTV